MRPYTETADLIPAPEALEGLPIKVEYTSPLAQAQKAVGVAAIERVLGFVGSLGNIRADVVDNLNADEMVREFAMQIGPPPTILTDRL